MGRKKNDKIIHELAAAVCTLEELASRMLDKMDAGERVALGSIRKHAWKAGVKLDKEAFHLAIAEYREEADTMDAVETAMVKYGFEGGVEHIPNEAVDQIKDLIAARRIATIRELDATVIYKLD